MSRRALVQGLGALIAFALAGIALGSAAEPQSGAEGVDPHPGVGLLAGKGPIRIDNSRAGRAIVSAHNIAPGVSRIGSVRVGIHGGPARVTLALRRLRSPPGPHGGELADALVVRIRKISGGRHRLLFSGHPAELPLLKLGRWHGGTRRFRLRVRFPGGATRQNRMQGAEASFAIVWSAVAPGH